MIRLGAPAVDRRLRATRWWLLVAAITALLLVIAPGAFAYWSVGGSGRALARTGTLDLAGAPPAVQAARRDVSVSWEQSQLRGRLLGSYQSGGYQVRRYDAGGRLQDIGAGCSGRLGGSGATLDCVEQNVPEGIWHYAITPILGGWTGIEGPHGVVTVSAAEVTLDNPTDGSVTSDQRPALSGAVAGGSPTMIAVTLEGQSPRVAPRNLTASIDGSSWSAQPVEDLSEGVYTVRARQVDRAGRVAWSHPHTFMIDITPPVTDDDTGAIGDGWKATPRTVTLRPADPGGSGVVRTYYTTDGSTPTTGSKQGTAVSVGEGIHSISYFSVDRASNHEAVRVALRQIRVDQTVPSIANLDPLPEVVRNGQVLTGEGEDAVSGVVRVVYEFCAVGNTSWTTIGSSTVGPSYSVVWGEQPADGGYQIRARVLDAAGNSATSAPQTVQVQNT
jgi:Bacterial Ig-like domain/Chitobiase/beta-hexosaminidase C-terminal domain